MQRIVVDVREQRHVKLPVIRVEVHVPLPLALDALQCGADVLNVRHGEGLVCLAHVGQLQLLTHVQQLGENVCAVPCGAEKHIAHQIFHGERLHHVSTPRTALDDA